MSFYAEVEKFLEFKEIVRGFHGTHFFPFSSADRQNIDETADSIKKYVISTLLIALVRYNYWDKEGTFYWLSNFAVSFTIVLLSYLFFYIFFAPFKTKDGTYGHRKRLNLIFFHSTSTLLALLVFQLVNQYAPMTGWLEAEKLALGKAYGEFLRNFVVIVFVAAIGAVPILANTVRRARVNNIPIPKSVFGRAILSCFTVSALVTTALIIDFSVTSVSSEEGAQRIIETKSTLTFIEALL